MAEESTGGKPVRQSLPFAIGYDHPYPIIRGEAERPHRPGERRRVHGQVEYGRSELGAPKARKLLYAYEPMVWHSIFVPEGEPIPQQILDYERISNTFAEKYGGEKEAYLQTGTEDKIDKYPPPSTIIIEPKHYGKKFYRKISKTWWGPWVGAKAYPEPEK